MIGVALCVAALAVLLVMSCWASTRCKCCLSRRRRRGGLCTGCHAMMQYRHGGGVQ